jgi:hypothetical protein
MVFHYQDGGKGSTFPELGTAAGRKARWVMQEESFADVVADAG